MIILVSPPRLCLRRRCRACRDISRSRIEITAADVISCRSRASERSGERARALADRDSRSAHALALRESWRALWCSRLVVWAAAVGAVLAFGLGPVRGAFNAPGLTRGFGRLGDLLAAPAARWDSAWYLVIAHYGYRPELSPYTASRAAFFPLYPLGISALSRLGLPPILAGVSISLGALWLALYGIHRLTALELEGGARAGHRAGLLGATAPGSGEIARLAVLITALAPMAFFFSAVYSESLYLALSVGLFWFARKGQWAAVGVLGALAAATRSAGVVLALPALMLYLYGPRADHQAARVGPQPRANTRGAGLAAHGAGLAARIRPRYKLRRDVLWLLLIPAGLGAYMTYLALSGGNALMPFGAQAVWGRQFAGPFLASWDGAKAAFEGARQLLSFQSRHLYFPLAGSTPAIESAHNLMLFAFLVAGIVATVGVLRRLPLAYGAYVVAALALPLSYPVSTEPLMSLPRFLLVLFPLNMWLALRLAGRPRLQIGTLALCVALLAFFTAEFATWHWVA
jgi:hypothetical protein